MFKTLVKLAATYRRQIPFKFNSTRLVNAFLSINPLKTKRICFTQGLSAYRAVNTLHFGYKTQSLDVL
jgi:hypothetical protein